MFYLVKLKYNFTFLPSVRYLAEGDEYSDHFTRIQRIPKIHNLNECGSDLLIKKCFDIIDKHEELEELFKRNFMEFL